MHSVDAVFHQAAQVSVPLSLDDPAYTDDVNVRGTLNLLTAARDERVERFIYASSSSVYGDPTKLPVDESSPFRPLSPYASSKIAAEAYCTTFQNTGGPSTVCLRYFNVFGDRQRSNGYASVIPAFINSLLNRKPMTIFGDGSQTRDFVHVNDVVEANMLALTADVAVGEPINVGSGKGVSVAELANVLRAISPGESSVPVHAPARKGDVRHSVADITKAKQILRYAPSTDLRSDLRILFKLYEEQLGNKKR
jgi:nucleoside-diphosphate-sugar epimerase